MSSRNLDQETEDRRNIDENENMKRKLKIAKKQKTQENQERRAGVVGGGDKGKRFIPPPLWKFRVNIKYR